MITANDINLAVMTVRRSPAYVHTTLASLFASDPLVHDLKGVHLVVGNEDAQYLSGYRHHGRISVHAMAQEEADQLSKWVLPRRVCFNYHRCLTLPPAGAAGLCICEDDALFQDGFIRAMLLAINEMEQEHKILKYILRLFIPFEFSPEQPVPVGKYCSKYNPRTFYGNVCMYYPSSVLPEVARLIHKYGVARYRAPADLLVRAYVEETDILYGTSVSLVQHVGFCSTLASLFSHAPSFSERRSKVELSTESGDNATITFDLCEALAGTIKRLGVVAERQGRELIYCADSTTLQCALKGDPEQLRQEVGTKIEKVIQSTQQGDILVRLHMEIEEQNRIRLHFVTSSDLVCGHTPALVEASEGVHECARSIWQSESMAGEILENCAHPGQTTSLHFSLEFHLAENPGLTLGSRLFADLDGVPALIVAKKAATRHMLAQMLSRWGMAPTIAEDGQSALTEIRERMGTSGEFRLLLLDADMSGMSGFETAKQIHNEPNTLHLKIVMLTRIRGEEDALCRKAGATGRVTKPILEHELLATVRGLLVARDESHPPQGYVKMQRRPVWKRMIRRLQQNVNRLAGV